MPQDPVSELLDAALQSRLVSSDQAATIGNTLRGCEASTRQDVAAKLVEMNVLTAFQAEQLLAGKGNECLLADRYVIRQKLGAGAMGTVFLADDTKLDRAVAIKVLPSQSVLDAGAVARFQREAKALAKLSHPNIIQAYDSDEDAGRHFLVMEYADGTNLGDLVRATGRISPPRAADYAYQTACGLENAHSKGLIHRDLKPGNLLLTSEGYIKILDLGLARFLQDQVGDATLTLEGTGMGTPDYMAPEQFQNARNADARSDIYSLGCTLYHLIAGQVPFPGSSLTEKYTAHEQREPPPLEGICPEVPTGLTLAIQKMMAKRPEDRFQSAHELAEALFPYVASSSRTMMPVRETASWHGSQLRISVVPLKVRRRQRLATGGAIGLAVLMLVAFSFWVGGIFSGSSGVGTNGTVARGGNENHTNRADESAKQGVSMDAQNGSGQFESKTVLTVSKSSTDGGDFRSITEALDHVTRPGMTIRVLDGEEYREALRLTKPRQMQGLTVESVSRATLLSPPTASFAILINGVPNVTLRGFKVKSENPEGILVVVMGSSPGAIIEQIECDSGKRDTRGVHIEFLNVLANDPPVQIRNCIFSNIITAIELVGIEVATQKPFPVRGVILSGNKISNCAEHGIVLTGHLKNIAVVENRVANCGLDCIGVFELLAGSDGILIANNVLQGPRDCLKVVAPIAQIPDLQIKQNLILSDDGPDMACYGLDQGALSVLRIANNYRHHVPPTSAEELANWLPAINDRIGPPLVPKSTDVTSPEFLAPPEGANLEISESVDDLPSYIGAVPPTGVEPWDWGKTWAAKQAAIDSAPAGTATPNE